MGLLERMGSAWDALFGLRRATAQPQGQPQRVGSPPDPDDALRNVSTAYEFFRNYTYLEPDRVSVYNDMDEMLQYVLVSSALVAFCEDATQEDTKTGRIVWAESANSRVQAECDRLHENLELDDRAFGDLWGLSSMGDHFLLNQYAKDRGIIDAPPLEPRIVWRHENSKRVLLGFSLGDVQTPDLATTPPYKAWDIIHFRLRTRRPTAPYGTPFYYDCRLTFKTLKLMEEQMAIYRVNMHPDRLIFKIFTGNASPDESMRILRRWKKAMEKVTAINQSAGKMTSEYAPWAIDQSLYWPVGDGDDKSGIEKFAGSANSGDIFDVELVRDLLFAGLRVPKAYMGFEDSQGYRSEDTLSQQSVKFARGVKRLRHFLIQGYMRLFRLHLELRGINSREPTNAFELRMAPVSYLDEAHKAELHAKRFEAVRYMMEIGDQMQASLGVNKKVWAAYVLSEFAGLEQGLIARLLAPGEAGDGSDLVYAPQGSKTIFEARDRLTKDDLDYIGKAARDDPKLRDILEKIKPVEDLDQDGRYSSKLDRQNLDEQVKHMAAVGSSDSHAGRILEVSSQATARFESEKKKRMKDQLRRIVEESQGPAETEAA